MENTNKKMNEKLADDSETFKFDAAPRKKFVTSHIAFGSGTIIEEGSASEASTPKEAKPKFSGGFSEIRHDPIRGH